MTRKLKLICAARVCARGALYFLPFSACARFTPLLWHTEKLPMNFIKKIETLENQGVFLSVRYFPPENITDIFCVVNINSRKHNDDDGKC